MYAAGKSLHFDAGRGTIDIERLSISGFFNLRLRGALMADEAKPVKKPRIRKVETVRERAEKAQEKPTKPRRIHKVAGHAAKPFKAAAKVGRKEYYPIKVREKGRPGRFLNKRRSWIPKYFRDAWAELKLVVWPTHKETIKLTVAVFIFAIIFGAIIAVTDYGLEKLFRRILL